MSEFLKAFQDLQQPREKKHFVTIEGIQFEVSLEKKLEVLKNGEQNYILSKSGITLRKPAVRKVRYSVLKTADKGYSFERGDIHWPNAVKENGETWQIEYE